MGIIARLRQKPQKVRARVALIFACVVVAIIALVGFFLYENPYKIDVGTRRQDPIRELGEFIPQARDDANQFVAPLENQFLIQ